MTDETTLRAAEIALQEAQLRSDVDALERMLHPNLTYVGPDGALNDKAWDLDTHRAGAVRVDVLDPEELRVTVADGVGVAVLTAHLSGTFDGEPFDARMRYTRAWAWNGERWRVVAGHSSFLGPPTAESVPRSN